MSAGHYPNPAWCAIRDSNPEPPGYEPGALPIERMARESGSPL